MLSVVCRAENNRYYLKRGVEIRPGYLARWVEFNVLDSTDQRAIIRQLNSRHEQASKETKKNAEIDHQKYFEGVNSDFNQQAIELRIQIEEAKLQRPLTNEEKQEIVSAQLRSKARAQEQQERV